MDSIEVLESQFLGPIKDKSKVVEKMHIKGRMGKLCSGIKQRCNEFLEDGEFQEYLQKAAEFLKANPLLACCLFAVLVGIALPIIIFILFVIANVAFVIAGFIILEVTIFIIGATVMSCSIFFVVTTAAMIGISILSFYLIFCYIIILLKKRKA